MSEESVGVFPVCLAVGNGGPGGIELRLSLLVDPMRETVAGYSAITQSINPPVDIRSKVDGKIIHMTVHNHTVLVVNAKGTSPDPHHPAETNLYLHMVLNNWENGTASYEFKNDHGLWIWVKDVPVKNFPCVWSEQENVAEG